MRFFILALSLLLRGVATCGSLDLGVYYYFLLLINKKTLLLLSAIHRLAAQNCLKQLLRRLVPRIHGD